MFRNLQRHPGKFVAALTVVVAASVLIWAFHDDLDAKRWIDYGNTLPIPVLLAAFLVLPVLGAPISVFLILAGMRFGVVNGMFVSTLCIFFHNAVAYKITHSTFRRPLLRWLERRGRKIPPIKKERQALYTGIFAAVHGPPYVLKIYLLALADIPFRIYLWVGATVYSVFALLPVAAGATATRIEPAWLVALVVGVGVLTCGIQWLARRIEARVAERSDDPSSGTTSTGRSDGGV